MTDSAIMVRVESLRPAEKQDASLIAMHNAAISNALSFASHSLGAQTWCEGDAHWLTLRWLVRVTA
jgi:hypothetical protein